MSRLEKPTLDEAIDQLKADQPGWAVLRRIGKIALPKTGVYVSGGTRSYEHLDVELDALTTDTYATLRSYIGAGARRVGVAERRGTSIWEDARQVLDEVKDKLGDDDALVRAAVHDFAGLYRRSGVMLREMFSPLLIRWEDTDEVVTCPAFPFVVRPGETDACTGVLFGYRDDRQDQPSWGRLHHITCSVQPAHSWRFDKGGVTPLIKLMAKARRTHDATVIRIDDVRRTVNAIAAGRYEVTCRRGPSETDAGCLFVSTTPSEVDRCPVCGTDEILRRTIIPTPQVAWWLERRGRGVIAVRLTDRAYLTGAMEALGQAGFIARATSLEHAELLVTGRAAA